MSEAELVRFVRRIVCVRSDTFARGPATLRRVAAQRMEAEHDTSRSAGACGNGGHGHGTRIRNPREPRHRGLLLVQECFGCLCNSMPAGWWNLLSVRRTVARWSLARPGVHPWPGWWTSAIPLALAAGVLGCSQSGLDRADTRGPTLVVQSDVRLHEDSVRYIGAPTSLTVARDGSLFVSDRFHNQVFEFMPDGRLRNVYGQAGDGPGEFRGVGVAWLANDTVVWVADRLLRRVIAFDRANRRQVDQVSVDGYLNSVAGSDATHWFGALNMGRRSSVAIAHANSREVSYVVEPPSTYYRTSVVPGIHTAVWVEQWRDTLLVGYSGTDYLLRVVGNSEAAETLTVPVARRRGIPKNYVRRIKSKRHSYEEIFAMTSALFGVFRLASGHVLTVHFDQHLSGPEITSKLYASVLTPDLSRACVDGEVPMGSALQPAIAVQGNELIAVSQHPDGKGGVQAIARRFRIDLDSCDWMPTSAGKPNP